MKTITLVLAGALALSTSSLAMAADAARGKQVFDRVGCWQCHGYEGQGGAAGKKLAPEPMAFDAFMVFVRETRGPMPPYQKAVLPDADLADIHAWLSTVAKPRDYRTIPLLRD